MIVSSQVDLVCWTERVCRDCREALTTVTLEEPAGSRNVQRSRGATGCRLFRDLRQLSGEPMPDPSMTAAAASHWQRYDFRCGSIARFRPEADHFRSSPSNRHFQSRSACLKSANMRHRTHWFVQRKSRPRAALNSILIFVDQAAINVCFDFRR
jgi:hypothetical protein